MRLDNNGRVDANALGIDLSSSGTRSRVRNDNGDTRMDSFLHRYRLVRSSDSSLCSRTHVFQQEEQGVQEVRRLVR